MKDCKGMVINKGLAEMLSQIYSLECNGEFIVPSVEGKSALDQLVDAGAVIENRQ